MDKAPEQTEFRVIKLESEIRLRAPRERVWDAMTIEQQKWYPYSYGQARLKAIVFEERVGGQCYEDWGDGNGTLYSTVTYFDKPKALCLRGSLKGAIHLEQWAILTEDGEETVLKHSTVAYGAISDDDAAGIRSHGELTQVASQLRAWVEDGVPVGT